MTHSNPLFSDIKAKYADAEQERHNAKRDKELAEKRIAEAEAKMRKFTDAWVALRAIYPDLPEMDNREAGQFANGNSQEEITTGKIKDWIEQTIKAIGRFASKSEIENKVLMDFAIMGLKKGDLLRFSTFLKQMKDSSRIVGAQGNSNHLLTFWGVPEFVVDNNFAKNTEPKTDVDITKWEFKIGRPEEEFDPEK